MERPTIVKDDFPAIENGKYRLRAIRPGNGGPLIFDVREYVKSESFEGFTRRGVRITTREGLESLKASIEQFLLFEFNVSRESK